MLNARDIEEVRENPPEGRNESSPGWTLSAAKEKPWEASRREDDAPEGHSIHFARDAVGYGSTMSHTYCCALFHCVFSTKERRRTIVPEIQPRLWAYMGGIARDHGMKALAVGGMADHVHILLSLPSPVPVADAMREIKSASSRWMHESCGIGGFEWQEGYGAFSIGWSQVSTTIAYIARQKDHHEKGDFRAEFVAFLKKNRIEYDPRYVWG